MLVSLQSYTLLHFKRKQLLRWNVCQLSEDRNIRNIPSVTKGETHTNRLSFRLNKHKVSYFRLLHFYFRTARALRVGGKAGLDGSHGLVRGGALEAQEGWAKVTCRHGETAGMVTPIQHGSPKAVIRTEEPNSRPISLELWDDHPARWWEKLEDLPGTLSPAFP